MKVKKQSTKTKQEEKDVGVLDRIRPMGFEEAEGFSINIYGRSGTGKTTLWGTFPKPILALLCSGGDRTGELRSLDTAANRKRIKYVVIEEPEELKEVIQYQHEEEEFATIVLDHVSDFQNLVLRKILGTDVLPEQKSWGMATREQKDRKRY
jgi:ABC-type glutathione transport system ATPase component